MAVAFYKAIVLIFVLELTKGGFDAGILDQSLVALLVAGVVARRIPGTVRWRLARRGRLTIRPLGYFIIGRTADKRGPENDDTQRYEREGSEDAQWQQPPFVQIRSHMPLLPAGSPPRRLAL